MAEEAAQLDRNAYRAAIMATAGFSRDDDAMALSIAKWLEGRLGSDVTVSNLRVPQGAGLANETILFEAGFTEGGERCTRAVDALGDLRPADAGEGVALVRVQSQGCEW